MILAPIQDLDLHNVLHAFMRGIASVWIVRFARGAASAIAIVTGHNVPAHATDKVRTPSNGKRQLILIK